MTSPFVCYFTIKPINTCLPSRHLAQKEQVFPLFCPLTCQSTIYSALWHVNQRLFSFYHGILVIKPKVFDDFISFLYCCETSSQTLDIEWVKYNKSRKSEQMLQALLEEVKKVNTYMHTITTYNAEYLNISSSKQKNKLHGP
jgi:hypothetical protein